MPAGAPSRPGGVVAEDRTGAVVVDTPEARDPGPVAAAVAGHRDVGDAALDRRLARPRGVSDRRPSPTVRMIASARIWAGMVVVGCVSGPSLAQRHDPSSAVDHNLPRAPFLRVGIRRILGRLFRLIQGSGVGFVGSCRVVARGTQVKVRRATPPFTGESGRAVTGSIQTPMRSPRRIDREDADHECPS